MSFKLPEAVGGSRWVRLIDTNRNGENGLEELEFGHPPEVTGRSLLLLILRPTRTRERSTAAERSFQRVVQTIEDASLKSVRFGSDQAAQASCWTAGLQARILCVDKLMGGPGGPRSA